MGKGKHGIKHVAILALGIAFAILQQPIAVLLVLAFAILAEKDQKLTKNMVLITFLSVIHVFIKIIVNKTLNFFFGLGNGDGAFSGVLRILRRLTSVFTNAIAIVFIVVYIFLLIKASKGEDIKLPLLDKVFENEEDEAENE